MAKMKDYLLEQQEKDQEQMAKDMEMFIVEHEAGQHIDGIVPFCERCEEERASRAEAERDYRLRNPVCEYGHQCTTACGKDRDCPCQADHLCSVTDISLEDAEIEADGHDCKLGQESSCITCRVLFNLRAKKEASYHCKICKDTGIIEIMGGSKADEWGVVDTKRCGCQED